MECARTVVIAGDLLHDRMVYMPVLHLGNGSSFGFISFRAIAFSSSACRVEMKTRQSQLVGYESNLSSAYCEEWKSRPSHTASQRELYRTRTGDWIRAFDISYHCVIKKLLSKALVMKILGAEMVLIWFVRALRLGSPRLLAWVSRRPDVCPGHENCGREWEG